MNKGTKDKFELNIKGPSFFKVLLFIVFAVVVVLVRRMDQLSYRHISEEEALELSQEMTVSIADQEIQLLDSEEKQTLKTGNTVKVIGVYKQKLNKGISPLQFDNQCYLVELADGTRGYGPLKEIREDTTIQQTQRVTYLGEGLREDRYLPAADTMSAFQSFIGSVKKFFLYDIRPITKKNGFFLFPKYQFWNEFKLPRWFRIILIVLAYIIEIVLIFKLWIFQGDRKIFRKARRGNAKACYWMGSKFEYGDKNVTRDLSTALEWYKRSADQGYGHACAHLGLLYEQGRYPNDIPIEMHWVYLNTAKQYFKTGATKGNKNCKKGFERLSKLLDFDSEFGKAYYAMVHGNGAGYYNMGVCYDLGYVYNGACLTPNQNMAFRLYQQSIDMGTDGDEWIASAWNNLGKIYSDGKCVNKDEKKAAAAYMKGAELGDPVAQYNLGWCYSYGKGVHINKSEAIRLWKQSARAGVKDAINALNDLGERY